MENRTPIEKALYYFKENNIFFHLFLLFKNNFDFSKKQSDRIDVSEFTDEELNPVVTFLEMDPSIFAENKFIELSEFEEKLQTTFGLDMSLSDFLTAYFHNILKIDSEESIYPHQDMKNFFEYLEKEYALLTGWFQYLKRGTTDSQWIYQFVSESPTIFEDYVLHLSEAVRLLPDRPLRLSLFSQIVVGETHAFDRHTTLGKLLLHVFAEDARFHAIEPVKLPESNEAINRLLLKFNILRDDITNYATVVNVYAETIEGYHPMWESAAHSHSVMNVPMRELINIVTAYPANEDQTVWIVENPVVFSSILDEVPNVPMICTHGEFNLATLELLDRLVEEECNIKYAGDITPDGIRRAERILMRYPENSQPWKMDIPSYLNARSDEEVINQNDMKKLNQFALDIFACLKDEMRDRKKMAYQEALLSDMISELKYYYQ